MTDGDGSTPGADTPTEYDRAGARDDGGREEHLGHLADLEDGCGCAEVWEHLSETRPDGGGETVEE